MKNRLFAIVALLALLSSFGMVGCKNTCQKAGDHFLGCIDEFCGDNEDNPMCAEEALTAMKGEFDEDAGGECTEDDASQAQEMLDTTCEDLTAMFDVTAAFAGDSGEEE